MYVDLKEVTKISTLSRSTIDREIKKVLFLERFTLVLDVCDGLEVKLKLGINHGNCSATAEQPTEALSLLPRGFQEEHDNLMAHIH